MFVGGIFWKKATKAGALTASAVGVFFVVLYKFCGVQLPFSSVFPILPSLVAFVIVSLCTQPKDQVQKNLSIPLPRWRQDGHCRQHS